MYLQEDYALRDARTRTDVKFPFGDKVNENVFTRKYFQRQSKFGFVQRRTAGSKYNLPLMLGRLPQNGEFEGWILGVA
jgi:hypothetical protein